MSVFDTSLAVKWFNTQETSSAQAFSILQDHIQNNNPITQPTFFYMEIANVLGKKQSLVESDLKNALRYVRQLPFKWYEVSFEDIEKASKLSRTYNTAIYDTIYFVIAKKFQTVLYTSDKKFADKIQSSDIIVLE